MPGEQQRNLSSRKSGSLQKADNPLLRLVGSADMHTLLLLLCRLSGVGGPEALPNLVDVMAFAAHTLY
jgi:hypothetical protein